MSEIKINVTKGELTQKALDEALETKGCINLTNKRHSMDLKINREKRVLKNTEIPLIKFALSAVLFILVLVGGILNTGAVEAKTEDHDRFLAHFPLETRVIGCYNSYTKETREDYICTKPWDKNIKLPARSQIVKWLKYYSEHQILNRLALVNFESWFNIYAVNDRAKWYVQTLKSHNVDIDIDSQLAWLKNRENKTYARLSFAGKYWKVRGCGSYWNTTNFKDWFAQWEYAVLACMYRFHYDSNKGSWYAKRGMKVTKFYKEYMFWIN